MNNSKNIFGNIIFGLILFIGSFFLLWLNEGNNAKNLATASYMDKKAVQIDASPVSAANDNLLVAVTGKAITDNTLKDENIELPNTLVLKRTVKMYQWEEKKHDSDGNETYEYVKSWSANKIDSDNFHDKTHINPDFPLESKNFYAQNAKFGDFNLTSGQISNIKPESDFIDLPPNSKYSVVKEQYYSGKNIQTPEIGDVLISYRYAPSGTNISIIGIQKNNQLTSFSYKNRSNFVQYNGHMNKEGIIGKYRHDNSTLTMILRLTGWLLMFIGLKMLISPIEAIFGFIPILGNIANSLVSVILALISLALSLVTIAIAWFVYRPVASIILVAVATIIMYIVKDKLPRKEI